MSWRTPITLLVLLGVLMGASYYGWKTIIAPATGEDHSSSPSTRPKHHHHGCAHRKVYKKGLVVKSKQIRVNVYNSGSISGLADDTMTALAAKGFRHGAVDNTTEVTASNVTILTGDKQLPQVQLVASQFKGLVKYINAQSLAPGVDVIVGDDFVGTRSDAKKHLRLKKTVKECTKR